MKIYTVLVVLLPFAGTIHAQHLNNHQLRDSIQNQELLTDIRWVALNKTNSQTFQVQNVQPETTQKQSTTFSGYSRPAQQQFIQQTNQNNRDYIQKMANQLFLTQKHVPLLSDYQKYIINQDPLVRRYVFGNNDQAEQKQTQQPPQQQLQQEASDFQYRTRSLRLEQNGKNNKGNAQAKTTLDTIKSNHGTDYTGQSSALQYITLSPPTNYLKLKVLPGLTPSLTPSLTPNLTPSLTPKLTLLSTVQPYTYYNLAGSNDLQTLQPLPLSASQLGLGDHKTYPLKTVKILGDDHHHVGDNYQFTYDVKDHHRDNNFGHQEVKQYDKTYGHYYLKLPDGRFETVKYWADKTGFHANVEFKGRAVHPESHQPHHPKHNYDIHLL